MASPSPLLAYRAHRCSFHSGRTDPYTRLGTVAVYVRDLERSIAFYRDQLGFDLAFDIESPSGDRWVAVAPPDGTAVLALVAPGQGSEASRLVGGLTQITFLTEDVSAKYEEWSNRGVHFLDPPRSCRQRKGGTACSSGDGVGQASAIETVPATAAGAANSGHCRRLRPGAPHWRRLL